MMSATVGAVGGSVVTYLLNTRKRKEEIQRTRAERKAADLEAEKLRNELTLQQKTAKLELKKLRMEVEILRLVQTMLTTDAFWERFDKQATMLSEENQIPKCLAMKNTFFELTGMPSETADRAHATLSAMISEYANLIDCALSYEEKKRLKNELIGKLRLIAESEEEMPPEVLTVYINLMLKYKRWLTIQEFLIAIDDPEEISSWANETGKNIVEWLFARTLDVRSG